MVMECRYGSAGVRRTGPCALGSSKQRNHHFRGPLCLYSPRGSRPGTSRLRSDARYARCLRNRLSYSLRWQSPLDIRTGRGDDQGIVGRIMYGVFIDVTERKKAEEAREMLAGEMNHRVKNIFAITSALTTISARSTTTKDEMVNDLVSGYLHSQMPTTWFVPMHSQQKKAAQLGDLLGTLLEPYASAHSKTERVHISTPRLLVGEKSATALALVVHELATNSIKYGALSNANGALDVQCSADGGEVEIIWSESGGPLTQNRPGRQDLVLSSLLAVSLISSAGRYRRVGRRLVRLSPSR